MRFARPLLIFVVAIAVAVLQAVPAREVAHAAFSGGNGKLLVRAQGLQLHSVNLDGSGMTKVADGANGSWSPDGERIAFDTHYTTGDISTMDADGSNVTSIFAGGTVDILPTWSPDGERIVFATGRGGQGLEIYTAKTDGSGVVKLTDVSTIRIEGNDPPKWSPDGSKILFIGQEPGTGVGGGDVQAGRPDQRRIANGGPGNDVSWDLYTVPAAGGGLTRLTNTEFKEFTPEWSPDGSRIAFGDFSESGIMVMGAGGGGATKIATLAGADFAGIGPVWSPDGQKIAYSESSGFPPAFTSHLINTTGGGGSALPVPGIVLDWQPVPNTKVEFTQATQQLQSISELKEDLKGDGKPPVPIVAGKPAAMRVLFDEVDTATTYAVEVTGEFTEDETVTLTPGCTQEQRRKQEAGCTSVDFYFTPPEDAWTVTLKVKEGGTLVEEHEFNLTSEKRDGIVLKAVDVCHARPVALGPWTCQSAASLVALAAHLRKVVPTDDVSVLLGGNQVRRKVSDYANGEDWMNDVVEDVESQFTVIDALTSALGTETYYFGLSDPLAGGYNGIANGAPGRGALSLAVTSALGQTTTHTTIAHEVGHLFGLEHTGVGLPAGAVAPGCWGPGADGAGWPFSDNKLYAPQTPGRADSVEVGFDVAAKQALPGDTTFELISYCAPRWVSAHSYVKLMSPTGPLRLKAAPTPVPGMYWLIGGAITSQGVDFRPLFAYETEGTTDPGSGSYRIEVQDGVGSPLFTRAFDPVEAHPELGPGQVESASDPFFGELVPVQAGAARIAVFDEENTEIGAITLAGAAPAVTITQAANDGDVVNLAWSVTDADSTEHTYWLDYSPDGGATWQNLAMGLSDAALVLDADTLAGSSNAAVRVIASDGVNSGSAVSDPFVVAGKLPHGEIVAPEGGSSREGSLVWLQAAAWDADDGTLDGGAVTWSSSLDGALGTGASLPVYDLSVGTHTITMTARDSDDNAVTDSITVTVYDGPIVEGQVGLSGDVDCSGAVNSVDALKLSRQVAGLPVAQTQPCPVIGTGDPLVFGDINCDGNITAVDTLFVLRFVAGMPVNLPQGCRQVGT